MKGKKLEKDNTQKGNTLIFDIETTVLYKYTDCRISEVYSIACRSIDEDKLQETIKTGVPKNKLDDVEFLKTFLTKPLFFRTMEEFLSFLKLYSEEQKVVAYAHNLDYELSYILRETLANSVKDKKKKDNFGEPRDMCVFRTNSSPIKIILDKLPNVTFKCSYALSGKSISTLGKTFGYKKLPYNYEIERRPIDELTSKDLEYNDRDVEIAGLFLIQKCLQRKEHSWELPLTFTGEMKKNKEKYIKDNFGGRVHGNIIKKRKKQLEYKDYDFFKFVIKTKRGGLTTPNLEVLNKSYENVFSVDFTSSYPDEMINSCFPRYEEDTKHIKSEDNELLYELTKNKIKNENNFLIDNKGFIGEFIFFNISLKEEVAFPCISFDSCIDYEDIEVVNGKVKSAGLIIGKFNNEDFYTILSSYNYENFEFNEIYITNKEEKLERSERYFIYDNFIEKQELKPYKDEHPAEYNLRKVAINSQYGKKQQIPLKAISSIINGEIDFTEFDLVGYKESGCLNKKEWIEKDIDTLQRVAYENYINDNCNKEIDILTDGMYISSKAKRKLIEAQLYIKREFDKLKSNYEIIFLYCDTDSLKYAINEKRSDANTSLFKHPISLSEDTKSSTIILHYTIEEINKKVLDIIKEYNKNKERKNKNNGELEKFIKFKEGKGIKVNEKHLKEILELGQFDIENASIKKGEETIFIPIKYFKTLGAKKYCYIQEYYEKGVKKEKLVTKIAGCSTKLADYITKYADDNNIELKELVDKIFNNGTLIGKNISGRTVCYREKRTHEEIDNLSYKGSPIIGYGGNMIENTSYTLSVSENDFTYCNMTYEKDYGTTYIVFDADEEGNLFLLEDEKEIEEYKIKNKIK